MRTNITYYTCYFFICIFTAAFSQNRLQLKLRFETESENSKFNPPHYTESHSDTNSINQEVQKVLLALWNEGYANVSADSLHYQKDLASTTIHCHQKFDRFFIVRSKYLDAPFTDYDFSISHQAFTAKEFARLREKILQFYEQNAYPFASVQLDSIELREDGCVANLLIRLHQRIQVDSIVMFGNIKLNKRYLERYIGIKAGDFYNERNVKSLNNRLRELPFLTQTKPYSVIFTKKYTKLILFLDKKKANKFDGFLGFLPNDKTGKINFTGQLNIKLLNSMAHGESVELEWRKLQALTQDLKVLLAYPYIFNLPFGVDYNIKLYRRDTTFIDVGNSIGLQYLLSGGNSIKFFVGRRNINLINTSPYEFATSLPEFADVQHTTYGFSLNLNNTDYKLNPRKGLKTTIQATAGSKQIRKNASINQAVYEGVELNTQQFSTQGFLSYFFPIFKKSTILVDAKFAKVIGKNLFTNELFRIGGLVSLRGFDEESINASAYIIPSIEYRYLFDQNSAIFLFANAAYYENVSRNYRVFDRPYGFGSGVFFETKAGIFSLTYALGKQFNNPILLRSGKIHFGLVSVF